MTPTLNKYTDNSGYYIQARPPEVGHVTYQVTPQTEEFITELGYSDSEELPWGLINPLRAAGEIYTQGTGVEQESQSAPELSPGSLPELSEDEADALVAYLEDAAEVGSDIVNQVRQKIDSGASEQSINQLSDLIERNIELPSPDGDNWEITYRTVSLAGSKFHKINFERGEDTEPGYMCQVYSFDMDDSGQDELNSIIMHGSGYDDRIGIALSHQRIILNCLSQLSDELNSRNMTLCKSSGHPSVNVKTTLKARITMRFDWE